LEQVRRVRNERERHGHNPLLFSLKCLEDDDAPAELIGEEIPALASNVAALIVAKKNH
jgi:hypothetical protein